MLVAKARDGWMLRKIPEDGKNDGCEEDRGQTAPGGGPFVVFGMVLGDTVFYMDSDNASNKIS